MRLKEIKFRIELAEQKMAEIEAIQCSRGTDLDYLSLRMEDLKDFLEDIRSSIERFLEYSRNGLLLKVCKFFLEKLLSISEKLKLNYLHPGGYLLPFYILDTIEMTRS